MSTQNPPSVLEGQVVKTWLFSQNPDGSLSPANLGGGSANQNVNLTGINGTAPALNNPLAVELSDGTNAFGTNTNPIRTSPASGAATQPISASALPLPSNAAQETGGNLAAIKTDTDTIAGAISGSKFQDNIAQIAGSTVATAATGVQKVGVVGNAGAAFDAPATGTAPANVLYQGDRAAITYPTAATDGQIVAQMADKAGRLVAVANAPRDLIGTAIVSNNSTASGVSFIGMGASGVYNDIITFIATNRSSTATVVTLTDGTASYTFAIAANGGIVVNFPTPLPATSTATAWTIGNSATVACDYIAVYAKNK